MRKREKEGKKERKIERKTCTLRLFINSTSGVAQMGLYICESGIFRGHWVGQLTLYVWVGLPVAVTMANISTAPHSASTSQHTTVPGKCEARCTSPSSAGTESYPQAPTTCTPPSCAAWSYFSCMRSRNCGSPAHTISSLVTKGNPYSINISAINITGN